MEKEAGMYLLVRAESNWVRSEFLGALWAPAQGLPLTLGRQEAEVNRRIGSPGCDLRGCRFWGLRRRCPGRGEKGGERGYCSWSKTLSEGPKKPSRHPMGVEGWCRHPREPIFPRMGPG